MGKTVMTPDSPETVEEAKEILPGNLAWVEKECSFLPEGSQGSLKPYCSALALLKEQKKAEEQESSA